MQMTQTECLEQTLIEKYCTNPDYADCFSVSVQSWYKYTFEDILEITFLSTSWWERALYKIRHILLKPFGLETASLPLKNGLSNNPVELKPGNNILFLKILDLNSNEILLETSDKHLKGWLSIRIERLNDWQKISVSTTVKYSNFFGRVYFFFIKPFHVLIMKSKMKLLKKEE